MKTKRTPATTPVRFDLQKMTEDLAEKNWTKKTLARRARVATMTVIRFMKGERQQPATAAKLAKALGYESARRYLIREERAS